MARKFYPLFFLNCKPNLKIIMFTLKRTKNIYPSWHVWSPGITPEQEFEMIMNNACALLDGTCTMGDFDLDSVINLMTSGCSSANSKRVTVVIMEDLQGWYNANEIKRKPGLEKKTLASAIDLYKNTSAEEDLQSYKNLTRYIEQGNVHRSQDGDDQPTESRQVPAWRAHLLTKNNKTNKQ
jgi:hypothetical protein